MALAIRMALYLVFGILAGQGLVIFDADAGTVTFKVDDLMILGTAMAGFVGTFITSRLAKAKGGAT